MDVPVDAATLVYGVFLAGMGRMDVDDVHFLPVPVGAMSTTVFEESQLKLKQGETYTPPSIVQDAPAKAGQRLFTLQTVSPRLPELELAPNGAARSRGGLGAMRAGMQGRGFGRADAGRRRQGPARHMAHGPSRE